MESVQKTSYIVQGWLQCSISSFNIIGFFLKFWDHQTYFPFGELFIMMMRGDKIFEKFDGYLKEIIGHQNK